MILAAAAAAAEQAKCADWARVGECEKNPTYMQAHCAAACARPSPVDLPSVSVSSSSKAAAAIPDGGQQFLLFDVAFHEQLNKQRRALMFYLHLAMRLKRTLVLPRPRLLQRKKGARGSQFEAEAEYMRWGELFNVSALNTLHPAVELDEFLQRRGASPQIDVLTAIDHKGCEARTAHDVSFNGLTNVRVGRSQCDSSLQHNVAALGRMTEGAIAFSNSFDQLPFAAALGLRPYVRFEQGVYDRAAAFVAQQFGGKPFLAIHWRRTDFLVARSTQPGVLQSAASVIRHARRAIERHGLAGVYLATDSDDQAELEAVGRALSPMRYGPAVVPTTAALRARADAANVEIAICAMAARFLGTKTSSFTLAISEERRGVFGHAADTNEEMDDLPAEEMKQAPPPARGAASAPPPATTPPERIAALGRYLLFDVAFHEQLNKQRRALMFYLHLAMRLKRTLVLPRPRLLQRKEARAARSSRRRRSTCGGASSST